MSQSSSLYASHVCRQDSVRQCEIFVANHQAYQTSYQEARDWLTSAHDQLVATADFYGDRLSLDAKARKIQVGS